MIVLNNFEEQYISLRKKEHRLYTDEQVKWLPEIEETHPHYKEWLIRENSCYRLIQHLSGKKKEINILEVGCGNGWLSAQLSKIPGSNVAGIDVNRTELDQARRVFESAENLEFFNCDIDSELIRNERFDAIIFAASIQYFPSLKQIISSALQVLDANGEIHIIDSFLYKSSEVDAARKRSTEYFQSIDHPEMIQHYFHHCIDDLAGFDHKIFYNPEGILNKLRKNKNPFQWICVYHHV